MNKRIKCFTVVVILVLTSFAFAVNSTNGTAISTKSICKKIGFSNLKFKENEGSYILNLENTSSYLIQPGKPVLPAYRKTFSFPAGTMIKDVKFEIEKTVEKTIDKPITVAPKPVLLGCGYKLLSKAAKTQVEQTQVSEIYPKSWFSYRVGRGIENGQQKTFLTIDIYPVQVNKNVIRYASNVKVNVKYELPKKPTSTLRKYDMVIISPSSFSSALQPLIEHKNSIGAKTKLVTLDEIYNNYNGRDKAEQIKYFIKHALDSWNIKYVLLVGDANKIPVRYTYPQDGQERRFVSDLYYADIYGNNGFSSWDSNGNNIFGEYKYGGKTDKVDLYPDVYIGRLACSSISDVETVVGKIIDYENSYKPWFSNFVACGGDTAPGDSEGVYEGEYTLNNILSNYMYNFYATKLYGSKTKNKGLITLDETKELTKETITEAIDNGAGFVDFAGHGNENTWATHPPDNENVWLPSPFGYKTSDISSLSNGDRLPVVILNACSCGKFTSGDSIAWEFVRAYSKGAVASIATTALSWGYIGSYCIEGLSGFVNVHFFSRFHQGYRTLGELFGRTIKYYLDHSPDKDDSDSKPLYYKTAEEWILFGDPSLKLGESSLKGDSIEFIEPQKGHIYINGVNKGYIGNKNMIIAIGTLDLLIGIGDPSRVKSIRVYKDNKLLKEIDSVNSNMVKIRLSNRNFGLYRIKITADFINGKVLNREIKIFQVKIL